MGFKKIYILGAVKHLDPESKHHHADGGESNQKWILRAEIDGRTYATHADLLYSAIDLVTRKRALGSRVEIIGDYWDLGVVLGRKPRKFLERCIKFG
jgi:hypothetical protein